MKSLLPTRRKANAEETRTLSSRQSDLANQDLFARLPTELILLIFQSFTDPFDLLSSLNVCRTWRAILLSPSIWPPLADRFSPGLSSHIRASNPDPSLQGSAFHTFLTLHHLRHSGLFTRSTHYTLRLDLSALPPTTTPTFTLSKALPPSLGGLHTLTTIPTLDPAAEEDHISRIKLYSNHRVAWWPEGWHLPYFAIVDDLRTKIRRMFLVPGQVDRGESGRRAWKTALGEKLFLMGQEDAGVWVWHLERDEMRRVELPGAFDRCVVEGGSILFVGRAWGQVWLWTWDSAGEGVRRVDVAGMGCYARGLVVMGGQVVLGYPPNPRPAPKVGLRFRDTDVKLDFILHPTGGDVFFVITWDEVDLVAFEVARGEVVGRIVCSREDVAYRIIQRSRTDNTVHYLRHEQCDAHGGYCLMTAWIGMEPICDAPCGYRGSLGSVCFNVYTKTFSAFVHHGAYQRTPDTHLWDSLLAVGIAGEKPRSDGSSLGKMKPVVALLRACDGEGHPAATLQPGVLFPVRSTEQESILGAPATTTLTFVPYEHNETRPRAESLQLVAYALEAGGGTKEAGLEILKTEWLNGDERTLIYVSGKEYTVWEFGRVAANEMGKKESRPWRDWFRDMVSSNQGRGKC